jgi:hypothetical protein
MLECFGVYCQMTIDHLSSTCFNIAEDEDGCYFASEEHIQIVANTLHSHLFAGRSDVNLDRFIDIFERGEINDIIVFACKNKDDNNYQT